MPGYIHIYKSAYKHDISIYGFPHFQNFHMYGNFGNPEIVKSCTFVGKQACMYGNSRNVEILEIQKSCMFVGTKTERLYICIYLQLARHA